MKSRPISNMPYIFVKYLWRFLSSIAKKVGDSYTNSGQCNGDGVMASSSGQTCVCYNGFKGDNGDKDCGWGDMKKLNEAVSYVTQCDGNILRKYSTGVTI